MATSSYCRLIGFKRVRAHRDVAVITATLEMSVRTVGSRRPHSEMDDEGSSPCHSLRRLPTETLNALALNLNDIYI